MEIRVDAPGQRPADAGGVVFPSTGRPSRSPPAVMRREFRCPGCGFGATVAQPPACCPLCGGGDWQLIRAMSASDDGEVVRS
jgi:hypothetical protein